MLELMSLQLHLHRQKLFHVGSMSMADRHVDGGDDIHWHSLDQQSFSLYKLCSLLANLLGYSKHLNLSECSHDTKSPPAGLDSRYL